MYLFWGAQVAPTLGCLNWGPQRYRFCNFHLNFAEPAESLNALRSQWGNRIGAQRVSYNHIYNIKSSKIIVRDGSTYTAW